MISLQGSILQLSPGFAPERLDAQPAGKTQINSRDTSPSPQSPTPPANSLSPLPHPPSLHLTMPSRVYSRKIRREKKKSKVIARGMTTHITRQPLNHFSFVHSFVRSCRGETHMDEKSTHTICANLVFHFFLPPPSHDILPGSIFHYSRHRS